MKKKFSSKWKASKNPRKQRKYLANAPLHLKRKNLSSNLSKELRKKYNMKNIPVKKEDTVRIMRGSFKGKKGKVSEVKTKLSKIIIEGIQRKKQDGSKVSVPINASNLQIVELNIEDKKRMKKIRENEKDKETEKEEKKKAKEMKKTEKKEELKDKRKKSKINKQGKDNGAPKKAKSS